MFLLTAEQLGRKDNIEEDTISLAQFAILCNCERRKREKLILLVYNDNARPVSICRL